MSAVTNRHLFLAFGLALAVVAGCNSSSTSSPAPAPSGSYPPSTSASGTVGTAAIALALNPISGPIGAGIAFPAATTGTDTANVTLSNAPPSNVPALSGIGTATAYLVTTTASAVTFPSTPSISFTIQTGATVTNAYRLASYQSGAWTDTNILGVVNGTLITFDYSTNFKPTIGPGSPLIVALYLNPNGSTPSPSPSPAASTSPTPSPSPTATHT